MKDSEVVHDDISPGTKFPVVKGVNHHEAGWVGTQFGVICTLKCVSQDKKTGGKRITLIGSNDPFFRISNSPPTLIPKSKIILRESSTQAAASFA